MRRCNAAPYEGNEKYIFVSYCHKDKDSVYPIIEHMAKDGYRIWFDEGINPGTDWPEIIAEHLDKCSVCISLITENSVNSHNCRREINFALLKKKPFISVYLQELQLSVGMEMQLSTTQSVFKYKYDKYDEFLSKLYSGEYMDDCKGKPMLDIVISDVEESDSKTKENKLSLLRKNTNEIININKDNFRIGRKKELCDYCIGDNKTISRVHLIFKITDTDFFVFDNDSFNGTKLNGKKIDSMVNTKIVTGDEIRISSERFTVIIEEKEI